MNLSPCNVRAMATSPDGRLLVTSCFDSSLHVYDCTTPSYKLVCKTAVSEGGVCALAVCASDRHDELTVVTGHWHWLVQCWRVAARQFQLKWVSDGVPEGVEKAKRRSATAACISHDCQWAAVAGYNNHGHAGPFTANDICLFSLRTAGRVFLGDTQSECISLCFSSDDRFLVSSSFDRTLRVWSVASGEQLQRLQLDSLVTCCMSLCAGGGLVTGHSDGSVRLWPALENFRLLTHRCIGRHGARVSSVHCSWDGRYAVTGGDTQDPTVRIWNLASGGGAVAALEGHTSDVAGVGATCSGDIVSSSWDKTVRRWQLDDPNLRRSFAPVRILLKEETQALQRARDTCRSSSPAAAVVFGILLDAAARRLWIKTNG